MSAQLKDKTFNGVKVTIWVADNGHFSAHAIDQHFHTLTLPELEAQLQKATKRAKVAIAIPVTVFDTTHDGEPLTITGRHAASDNLLMVDGTGRKFQLPQRTWNDVGVVRRMTPEQVNEYRRLEKVASAAAGARDAFIHQFKFEDLAAAIRQAQVEAEDTPIEAPEPTGDPR